MEASRPYERQKCISFPSIKLFNIIKGEIMRYFILIITLLSAFTFAQPPKIVYTENVKVGPYNVTVGFSRWPVQADKSRDFTFAAEGGIADKSGTITMILPTTSKATAPEREFFEVALPLARYARDRNIWGMDVIALPEEGQWKFKFEIDGPQGKGIGSLDVVLLARPAFLPPLVNWAIGLLPLIGLISVAWRRAKTGKRAETWSWGEAA
jgi:hypothetical protein